MSKLKINVDIILEEENRKCLIIGLNETLGSFGSLSIAMNLFKYYSGIFPDINNCITQYLCLGGFRSYLKEFLDYIIFLKTKNCRVVLVTYNSGSNGYVDYIIDCIEIYMKNKNIFDLVITDVEIFENKQINEKLLNIVANEMCCYKENIYIIDNSKSGLNVKNYLKVNAYDNYIPILNLLRTAIWWDNYVEECILIQPKDSEYTHVIPVDLNNPTATAFQTMFYDIKKYSYLINENESIYNTELLDLISRLKMNLE
jgi:hypothetical protein